MTPERQAEMQRSLMTMLGDRRQIETPAAAPKPSRSIKLSADAPPPIPPAAVVQPPAPPTDASGDRPAAAENINNESTKQGGDSHFVSDTDLDRWACTLCTLLNHPLNEYCEACDTPRC